MVGAGVPAVILAIAAPAAMVVAWGALAAPRARHRLALRTRAPFEIAVFALAALALVAAGRAVLAALFAGLVVLNAALLTAWRQWEL